ncbi:MAG TPA: Crp/Fnr family transcriptional regulator [Aestuariivirgaceae bacterium]|jgi:CRP-like cAMP-binding protein
MPTLHRSLIQSFPLFSAMTDMDLDDVMARAKALRIPKGMAVFEQGQQASAFYVLLQGRLKVVQVTPDGQQVVIRFVVPGDIYGIAKALNRPDYPATATAIVDSVTLAWDMTIWDEFMARHPTLALNVMKMMGRRVQDAHTRVKEMATEDVERRVAHALLRLVEHSGREVEQGVLVDFPVTRQVLAEASGTTLHSVSRILSAWEDAGVVVAGRQKVIVCDLAGLSRIAEQDGCGRLQRGR